MTSPHIGSFIRPVGYGGYGYSLRILNVLPEDHEGPEQWHCERWGMRDGMPYDDGHVSKGHYLNGLKNIFPGVWKDEWDGYGERWSCCPLYYRAIEIPGEQMGLF